VKEEECLKNFGFKIYKNKWFGRPWHKWKR